MPSLLKDERTLAHLNSEGADTPLISPVAPDELERACAHRSGRFRKAMANADVAAQLLHDPANIRHAFDSSSKQVRTAHNPMRSALILTDGPLIMLEFRGEHRNDGRPVHAGTAPGRRRMTSIGRPFRTAGGSSRITQPSRPGAMTDWRRQRCLAHSRSRASPNSVRVVRFANEIGAQRIFSRTSRAAAEIGRKTGERLRQAPGLATGGRSRSRVWPNFFDSGVFWSNVLGGMATSAGRTGRRCAVAGDGQKHEPWRMAKGITGIGIRTRWRVRKVWGRRARRWFARARAATSGTGCRTARCGAWTFPEERLLEALLEAVLAEFRPQLPGLAADLASDAPGLMPSAAVAKSFLTRLGRVEVERTCFHCRSCDKGSFPPDRAPDLEGSAFAPGMASVIAGTAQLMSFEAASRHVANLEGLDLVTSQVPVKCFCACHGSLTPGCPTSPHQFG